MSILNAWVTPSRATVAVDTDFFTVDGSRAVASKLLTLPHLPAVIGLRGQAAFFHLVYMACATRSFEKFDQMVDYLSINLRSLERELPDSLLTKNYRELGNEIIVIGWSDRLSEMTGRQFSRRGEETEFSGYEFGHYISPSDGLPEGFPTGERAAQKIAQAQVNWLRSEWPDEYCGGKLLLCHITRKSVSVRHEYSL